MDTRTFLVANPRGDATAQGQALRQTRTPMSSPWTNHTAGRCLCPGVGATEVGNVGVQEGPHNKATSGVTMS